MIPKKKNPKAPAELINEVVRRAYKMGDPVSPSTVYAVAYGQVTSGRVQKLIDEVRRDLKISVPTKQVANVTL